MANDATLADLRTAAQRRADMTNSTFVSDAEWLDYINFGVARLHRLLVSKYGDDYYLSTNDITLVSGTSAYSLPTDFLKVRGVSLIASSGEEYPLRRYMFEERHTRQYLTWSSTIRSTTMMYRILGGNIEFIPQPAGSGTVRLFYVPQVTKLADDTDVVDARLAIGWEEYIVLWAAIQAVDKDQPRNPQATDPMSRMLAKIEQEIQEDADNRDIGEPMRVIDIHKSYNTNYIDYDYV